MRALLAVAALSPALLLAQPRPSPDIPTDEELELVQLLELLDGIEDTDLDLLGPSPASPRDGGR